jgi:hypothetical protein
MLFSVTVYDGGLNIFMRCIRTGSLSRANEIHNSNNGEQENVSFRQMSEMVTLSVGRNHIEFVYKASRR